MNLELSPNEIVQQRINIWKEQFYKHIPYKGSPWATTPVEQSRENTEGNVIE